MATFATKYVEIAENIANSKLQLEAASGYLDSTGGVLQNVVDVTTTYFTETDISEVDFEIALLQVASITYGAVNGVASNNGSYLALVRALNNFVVNNVLGNDSYASTLQLFIDDDCTWSDLSDGVLDAWKELCVAAGYEIS